MDQRDGPRQGCSEQINKKQFEDDVPITRKIHFLEKIAIKAVIRQ